MELKEEANPKTYFIGYDIFGYFLPGSLLVGTLSAGNTAVQDVAARVWEDGHAADFVALAVAAYLLGHAIAALSSWLLEKMLLRGVLNYPTPHLFKSADSARAWWRFIVPSYDRPYSTTFQKHFDELFEAAFGMSAKDAHDRFWLCWSYNSLHHPAAYRRGTHFLNLYGYSRNIAMALFITMAIPLLPHWSNALPAPMWAAISFAGGWVMFVGYTKLLRRLNDETYRGFYVVSREIERAHGKADALANRS